MREVTSTYSVLLAPDPVFSILPPPQHYLVVQDTIRGFWRLGYNIFICILAPFLIHIPFSYATLPYWLPNPLLPIYISNVHKLKHGSDSETYDTEVA